MQFQCMHCNQRYEVEDQFAGRSVTCKICGNTMKVPVPIGRNVEIQDEVVQISVDEMRQNAFRRRRQRRLRRAAIAVAALLAGMVIGAIAMIIIGTPDKPVSTVQKTD